MQSLGWGIRLVTILLLPFFSGFSAHAVEVPRWEELGRSPFTGTLEEACALHGLSEIECERARDLSMSNRCRSSRLNNGDILEVTFTDKAGNHHVKRMVVAFQLSLDDPARATLECDLGGGKTLVIPTCGNYSLQEREVPYVGGSTRQQLTAWQAPSRPPRYIPGVTLPGPCCGCVRTFIVLPSLYIRGGTPPNTSPGYSAPRHNP